MDIINGETPDKPVFQVINAKKIDSANTVDRYRLLISDGKYLYSHVMLAAQLNKLMANNEITNNSVIEVTKFMCNKLQGDKRVIILLEVNVLAKGKCFRMANHHLLVTLYVCSVRPVVTPTQNKLHMALNSC